MNLEVEYFDDGSSFLEVSPLSINPEHLMDFSLYERYPLKKSGQYRFRCLLVNQNSMPRERLLELLSSWETVYVHRLQQKNYSRYVRDNLEFILNHEEIDVKKKSQALTEVSTEIIGESFAANFALKNDGALVVKNIENLVSKAISFISDIKSLQGLADLIGHDYQTHTHSIKVGWLIATFINANRDLFDADTATSLKELIVQATVAGFLHYIGKVKMPRHLINKRGRLNNTEYVVMQSHTAYAVSLLFGNSLPRFPMEAILYHHENEDGSGYPCGLAGEQIPLLAKICHIVDVFDALTSKRPYKSPVTPFEALKIMAGKNPHLGTLRKFETEVREKPELSITPVVRDNYPARLRHLREREILEEEAEKRVEVRTRLRDQGMAHCFDRDLLRRFIITINRSESFELSGLL